MCGWFEVTSAFCDLPVMTIVAPILLILISYSSLLKFHFPYLHLTNRFWWRIRA